MALQVVVEGPPLSDGKDTHACLHAMCSWGLAPARNTCEGPSLQELWYSAAVCRSCGTLLQSTGAVVLCCSPQELWYSAAVWAASQSMLRILG